MSLFKELKRRSVIRVSAAYVIIAWLLIQVLELAADSFEAPAWVMKMIITAAAIGFIPAALFSWAFELTPEGIKKDSEVDKSNSDTSHTAKKLDYVTIAAALGVAGLFGWQQINPPTSIPSSESVFPAEAGIQSDTAIVGPRLRGEDVEGSGETNSASQAALTLGVAVLPFTNLSQDENNAFFAGGVHEDVLTYLSRIDQLRVISRTSMLKIAEHGMGIKDIGKHLDVSHVLEGSVRRAGDQVRVTVQLIDATNDEHLWAENYDRELDDIFLIQTEIAKAIATQLKTELSPKEQESLSNYPTINIKAYDLYSKSREIIKVWRGADTFREMIPLLEQSLVLDPNFLEAKVMLAMAYGRLNWIGVDSEGTYLAKAKALTDNIVKTHPNTSQAYQALGNFQYTIERDYQAAFNMFQKALVDNPNDSELLLLVASAHKRLGQFDQGIPILRKLYSLDPEHSSIGSELGLQLWGAGQLNEARQKFKEVLAKSNSLSVRSQLASLNFKEFGEVEKFQELLEPLTKAELLFSSVAYTKMQVTSENVDEYLQLLKQEKDNSSKLLINLYSAILLTLSNEQARAQEIANKAISNFELKGELSNTTKEEYLDLMRLACFAKDTDKFTAYEKRYQQLDWKEKLNVASNLNYSLALAECGQIQKAWEQIQTDKESPLADVTDWSLVFDPIYSYYFSELPEYQALKKKMLAIKAARDAQ